MIQKILAQLFPPKLPELHPIDDLRDVLEHQARCVRIQPWQVRPESTDFLKQISDARWAAE